MIPEQQPEEQEDSFEKSLNPMTAKYLNKKITQKDSLAKIDLRHMCENVLSITLWIIRP